MGGHKIMSWIDWLIVILPIAFVVWIAFFSKRYVKGVVDYLKNFNVSDRDMNKFIIGTMSNIDRPMTPSAKGSRSMNLYMNHVTEEMIRTERNQILDAGQADIRALAQVVQAMLDQHLLCVIGSEDKIEEQKDMFLEVRTLN